jgi:D-inositol-3-phosphate glycosyltransferase
LGERDTGGMNVFLREVAKALDRRGVSVDIFTRVHDPKDPQIVQAGERVRVIHLPAGPLAAPKKALYDWLPGFSAQLDAFLAREQGRYDVIHGHYWLSAPATLALAQRWGVPAVMHFHTLAKVQRLVRAGEPDAPQRAETEQAAINGASRIVCGSPGEREQLVQLYGASPGRCRIVPCGFDDQLFRPLGQAEARRAAGLPEGKIVLFVGRMERIKGVDILVRAVAALERREQVRIVIIGGVEGDPELERLRRMLAELGIGDCVSLLGTVDQQRLPLYYSAADVCVVPSFYETFGMVALESMACGTPVIAARVGGLAATVADGQTGYLVPWHCPEPYTERLEVMLGNDGLRGILGQAARASVQRFTWPRVAERLLQVYEEALGAPAVSLR